MKKKLGIALLAFFAIASIVFGVLFFTSNSQKNSTIKALTTDVETKAGEIETLTADVEAKQDEIATLTADVETKTGEIATLTADVETKAGEIATLTADVETKAGEIATLTADVEAKAGEIATLTADVEAKAGEIATLTTDAETKAAEIATLTVDAETKAAEIAALTADVETKDGEIAALTADVEAKNSEIATLTADNQTLTDSLTKKTDGMAALQVLVSELGTRNEELELQAQALLSENELLKTAAEEASLENLTEEELLTVVATIQPQLEALEYTVDISREEWTCGECSTVNTGKVCSQCGREKAYLEMTEIFEVRAGCMVYYKEKNDSVFNELGDEIYPADYDEKFMLRPYLYVMNRSNEKQQFTMRAECKMPGDAYTTSFDRELEPGDYSYYLLDRIDQSTGELAVEYFVNEVRMGDKTLRTLEGHSDLYTYLKQNVTAELFLRIKNEKDEYPLTDKYEVGDLSMLQAGQYFAPLVVLENHGDETLTDITFRAMDADGVVTWPNNDLNAQDYWMYNNINQHYKLGENVYAAYVNGIEVYQGSFEIVTGVTE